MRDQALVDSWAVQAAGSRYPVSFWVELEGGGGGGPGGPRYKVKLLKIFHIISICTVLLFSACQCD